MSTKKFWLGFAPKTCDICQSAIKDSFIDGRTVDGPWANMCPECHNNYGVGLGTGKGQEYRKTNEGWLKING